MMVRGQAPSAGPERGRGVSRPNALITGGSRGIGRSIALRLAAAGYDLTLVARREDALQDAAAAAREHGVDVDSICADLRDRDAGRRCILAHERRFGSLNALILNAGTGMAQPLGELTEGQVDTQIALNFATPCAMVDAAVPLLCKMAAAGARADVVVISSLLGAWPRAGLSAYSATKAALTSLARSINVELGAFGVRAFSLCPGFVDTELAAWVHDDVPRETMIRDSDVADIVTCLLQLSRATVVPELLISRVAGNPFTA